MDIKEVYLDNASTTRIDDAVLKEMIPYFNNYYGNPSSLHKKGVESYKAIQKSRQIIADFLHIPINEVIFTSGGTESNNLAIKGIAYANKRNGNHIITTQIEHPSVLETCKELEKDGFIVTYLPVDSNGLIEPSQVYNSINDNTILVSIMHVNNEIGSILPIEEVSNIIKRKDKKIYFHIDAVQSFGKVLINLETVKADLLSISSHKIYGPKGVGALIIRNKAKLKYLFNGGEQEYKIRPGTENVAGIVGFGKAVELLSINGKDEIKKMTILRDKLIKGVFERVKNVKLNGHNIYRVCNNVNFSFIGLKSEIILHLLESYGIYVSSGSACTSKKKSVSHVLKAIGLSDSLASSAIRLTLSKYNNEEEIDYTIEKIETIIKNLSK